MMRNDADSGLAAAREVIRALFGPPAGRTFDVRYWNGTEERSERARTTPFTLVVARRGALRRMLLPPNELSIVEAYISGDLDIEGDLETAVGLGDAVGRRLRDLRAFRDLTQKVFALPTDDDPEIHRTRFQRVSDSIAGKRRRGDAQAIEFHYGVSNEFYALWLDPMMLYTCAYFRTGDESIELAQLDKLEHICRKLRLKRGDRLLDIGCGWGGLVRYAAKNYGVDALGITLSESQASWGRERIRAEGLSGHCRVEVRDYRDLPAGEQFDKITSVGVTEHVPADEQPAYFARAHTLLRPGGVFLNHCEVSVDQARGETIRSRLAAKLWKRGEFIQRYVFPDARLVPAAHVIASAESSGFEVRDVEGLREHYTLTLRHWIRELENNRDSAIELVGERTYRVWRLYMSAGAHRFDSAKLNIIQTLLSKPHEDGRSELPWTREDIYSAPYPSELEKKLELRTSA
ncbi:MAG: class I SAM-dependent methyltransferase [Gemmatimonadaceae bacterium]